MSRLGNILFIARKDIRYTLQDRGTVVWLFVMPLIFFYFIGNATGGFGRSGDGAPDKVAMLVPADAGFLSAQLATRLSDAGLDVVTFAKENPEVPVSGGDPEYGFSAYTRQLTLPEGMTNSVLAGEAVELQFETRREQLGGDFDSIRIQRAIYTTVADIVASQAEYGSVSQAAMKRLNDMPRRLSLKVTTAGARPEPPSGFQQAVPGTMVMFTMLVLLTSGAVTLLIERKRGVLERLASAPISRGELVAGKWLGKMALALVQIAFAMLVGMLLFRVTWHPDLWMIALLLTAWAGFCTSCALLLGSVGRSEGQVVGIGVLLSLILGGLGGCWWPIEVAPGWMQSIAAVLPSGWTMTGLHNLMSFQAGPLSALGYVAALTVFALLIAAIGARYFRYR